MAQDVGTMRIRVEADTADVEQGLKRTTSQLEKMQISAVRAQRNAARASTVAQLGGLGISAGMAGYQIYRNRRTAANLARTGARVAARAGARVAARGAFGSMGAAIGGAALPVLGIIGAIGAVALAVKTLKGVADKILTAAEEQAAALKSLTRESVMRNQLPRQIQARRFMESDPFGRSLGYQRSRIEELGFGVTRQSMSVLGRVSDSQRELELARQTRERYVGSFGAPYEDLWNRIRTTAIGQQISVGRSAAGENQFGIGLRSGLSGDPALGPWAMFDTMIRFGRNPGLEQGRNEAVAALNRQREMLRLQTMGPGAIMTAAPTIRAGSEADYQLRVRMQRQELVARQTVEWQNKILALMEQMVESGTMDPEELARQQIRYGRQVPELEGVE